MHELVGLLVDVAGSPLPPIGVDDGETVRVGHSGGPKAPYLGWCHRGSPSTCSPTMFLLISVVPPAMEAWRTANRLSPQQSEFTSVSMPTRSTARAASSCSQCAHDSLANEPPAPAAAG